LLTFGIARDIIGNNVMQLECSDNLTVGDLRIMLEKDYAALARLSSYMIAVNDEYAQAADQIHEGDEIAIIPPVSGG
jgi:molybdopterin synthase sulfur carrier subunit